MPRRRLLVAFVFACTCCRAGSTTIDTADAAWSRLGVQCPRPVLPGPLSIYPIDPARESLTAPEECRSLESMLAAAVLRNATADAPSPTASHRSAIASLVTGEFDDAVSRLELLTAADSMNGAAWNDLAVSYLTRARAQSRPVDVARAADAAKRAQELDAGSQATATYVAAWQELGMNDNGSTRETILEELAKRPRGAFETRPADVDLHADLVERYWLRAWADAAIGNSWSQAQDIAAAAESQAARIAAAGGDASLSSLILELSGDPVESQGRARGWRSYLLAREAFERSEFGSVEQHLGASAILSQAGPASGMRLDLLRASAHRIAGRSLLAQRLLTSMSVTATALQFAALDGRRRWQLGLIADEAGSYAEAVTHYQAALDKLSRVGDREAIAVVSGLLATVYRELQHLDEAWKYQIAANRMLSACSRLRRQSVLTAASLTASSMGLHRIAIDLRQPILREVRQRADATGLAFLLLDEVADYAALDDRVSVTRTLAEYAAAIASVSDAAVREMLQIVLAETIGAPATLERSIDADEVLTAAIGIALRRSYSSALPGLLYKQARVRIAEGRTEESVPLLRQATREISQQSSRSSPTQMSRLRAANWPVYLELTEQLLRRGDTWEALAVIEDAKARSGMTPAEQSMPLVSPTVPSGTLAVCYAVLPERVVAWWTSSTARGFVVIEASPAALAALVNELQQAIRTDASIDSSASALYALLLGPLAMPLHGVSTLVISGDGPIHAIPFAALRNDTTGHRVVDDMVVLHASSLLSRQRQMRRQVVGGALVVGDPARASAPLPAAPLPFARREAEAVARVYAASTLLLDREATAATVIKRLAGASVFHYSGHAFANSIDPDSSYLALAPDSSNALGALFAKDLQLMTLGTSVAVLAACETLGTRTFAGGGWMGLSQALIVAGVRDVVATYWPIDDRESTTLFIALHRSLAAGDSSAVAVRKAQLASRQLGARPYTWASISLMTSLPFQEHRLNMRSQSAAQEGLSWH